MPIFTQKELEEFAHLNATEQASHDEQLAQNVVDPGFAGPVIVASGESATEVEMKQEIETDIQQVPVKQTIDEDLDDERDEFVETIEHVDADADGADGTEDQLGEVEEPSADISMQDAVEEMADGDDDDESATEPEDDADKLEDGSSSASDGGEASSDEEDDEDRSKKSDDGSSESEEDSESSSEEEDGDDDGDIEADERDEGIDQVCSLCRKPVPTDATNNQHVLRCTGCDTPAHTNCTKDDVVLEKTETSEQWRCRDCLKSQASESPKETSKKNRNSASRLVRDLLPVSRGVQKPNSHSIFNQPLISEGEDGGRALRKRKSPTAEPPGSEKRRRKATPKAISASLPEESKIEPVAHATRRASQKVVPTARILQYRPYEKAPPHKFILAFRLDQSKIAKILSKPPRPGRRRDRRRPPKIPPPPIYQPPVPKFPALPTNYLVFPSMWGDRDTDANAKPYGGILSEGEADTSRSLPQLKDRELFEIARKEAEEERRKTSAAAEAEMMNGETASASKPNRIVSGPPSKIRCIQFGKHVIDTFYAAPYPEEYSHEARLFICEFCLKYLPSEFVAYRHKLKCPAKHPPGDEIYRDGTISIWEVDGRKKTEYCQCLCLMAKMFLGSKTLYYDVEPFLFYILTEYDEFGYHFVGYFSKEKRPASQNNVSCILVMPIHQRKGYATFLIDFSYLLTRIEGKDGSPEKPLSDMGLTAYRSYWDLTIAKQLLDIGTRPFSTKELMQRTGMTADDVVHSLERLYAFVKDPVTKIYAIRYDQKLYESIVNDFESKKHRILKPDNLIWTPYIMGRSDQAHLDTQPVQTIAPREGEDAIEVASESRTKEQQLQNGAADHVSPKISPKTFHDAAMRSPVQTKDPQLVSDIGHVAPGPPSAQLLTGDIDHETSKPGLQTNGIDENDNENGHGDEGLTGYALIHHKQNIPSIRFQIDPPIPASMLRSRSHKKRNTEFNRVAANGESTHSPSLAPVRSSPRHASSANGSVNGSSDAASPEKPSTPVRRSGRKSGLSNMETIGMDGSVDHDEEEDPDVGDEIEAKIDMDGRLVSESSEEESSEEDVEEDVGEDDEDEEDEDEEDDEEEDEPDDDDPDALDIANGSGEDDSDDD